MATKTIKQKIFNTICGCGDTGYFSYGIKDVNNNIKIGTCPVCNEKFKKKKIIIRKIDSETNKIIPTDEVINIL